MSNQLMEALTPLEKAQLETARTTTEARILKMLIKEAVNESLRGYVAQVNEANNELSLNTIGEICEMFRITPATVHNWKKRGWLVGKRLGKNRYFSRQEVDEAMRKFQIGTRYSH